MKKNENIARISMVTITLRVVLPKKFFYSFIKEFEEMYIENRERTVCNMSAHEGYQLKDGEINIEIEFSMHDELIFYEFFFRFCERNKINFFPKGL